MCHLVYQLQTRAFYTFERLFHQGGLLHVFGASFFFFTFLRSSLRAINIIPGICWPLLFMVGCYHGPLGARVAIRTMGGGGSIRRALKVGIARCTGITCCHIGSSRVVMRTGGGCVRGGIQRVFNTSIATYVPIIVVVTFKISEVSFILQHSSSRSFFCDVFVDAYRPWLAPAS